MTNFSAGIVRMLPLRMRFAASRIPVACGAALLLASGCSSLLDVKSTQLRDEDISTAKAAETLWQTALVELGNAVPEASVYTGLLTDELFSDLRVTSVMQRDEMLDRRDDSQLQELVERESWTMPTYRRWNEVRRRAMTAMFKLRPYTASKAHLGEMYATLGYVTVRMGEDFCGGFPLNEIDAAFGSVVKPPMATGEVLERAAAYFDSAATYASDSSRILNFARIGRGRALLGLGRFAEAKDAIAGVPVDYTYSAGVGTALTPAWGQPTRSVADRDGGNGLDFVSAQDPRVPTTFMGTGEGSGANMYEFTPYNGNATPLVIASGVEAQLIAAEAALHDHPDDGQWLATLNTLRATRVTPALAALTDPGTPAGRVDLLFRERAFWLFATGHRLGDLRRLIDRYGRGAETVFPTGTYHSGGVFSAGTNFPFEWKAEAVFNHAVTGCIGS